MQLGSTTRPARELRGVTKTLRHVYTPVHEPSAAIARMLEALAHREAHTPRPTHMPHAYASVA